MSTIRQSLFTGRMLCVLLYGISSGVPLLLTGSTLKVWMKDSGVDLAVIGVYALVGLPYTLKFLWAPIMDRYTPPLGRRRGWILICQIGLALALAALASLNPARSPWYLGLCAVIVTFLSASQDIAIDAYRRDILKDEELGLGSAMAVNGYRVGMLIGGSALAISDHLPWRITYLIMAGIMAAGTIITLLSPEPERAPGSPRTLQDAVVLPFKDFLKRSYAIEFLIFIFLYKIGDSMASDMLSLFYRDLKFEKTEIFAISKVFGLWATILGGTVGGVMLLKLGMRKSLWIFGILQMVSTYGFVWLNSRGHDIPALTGVIIFETVTSGLGSAAYVGFISSLCNRSFSATQYALLSSLSSTPRVLFGSLSGVLAAKMGWPMYFTFCTLIAVPGLLMLLRSRRWSESAPILKDTNTAAS